MGGLLWYKSHKALQDVILLESNQLQANSN